MSTALAVRLREARMTCSLKQAAIAEAIGVNTVTISRWEHGRKLPSEFHLHQLAPVLRIPITELLTLRRQAILGSKDGVYTANIHITAEPERNSAPPLPTTQRMMLAGGVHILTISTPHPISLEFTIEYIINDQNTVM